MHILSQRVVDYRKRKGLTQEQLAAELNMSRGVLAGVESGSRTPSKEMAIRLSEYFQVPLETFLMEKNASQEKKTLTTQQIIMLADIVQEVINKQGFQITQEQRAALVDYFLPTEYNRRRKDKGFTFRIGRIILEIKMKKRE